jgi:glycosyltransferase involved in cell wall biosynthesis
VHVVVVTHYFPPIGGPGARRMLGWVNGFVAAGARVTVVTPEAHPRDPYYQPEERYAGPATVVTPAIFDPARFARGGDGKPVVSEGPKFEKRGLAARLRPWLLLPDQRRLANGPLVRAALAAIGDEPAIILTSSPYNSVHLAGRAIKKRLGDRATWIADFRDDWFHPVFFPFPNGVYRAYNRRLEAKVLRDADGLTIVSRSTLDKVRSRHADLPANFWSTEEGGKWRWAPNGFDTTGVEAILNAPVPSRDPSKPVNLLFSGTLWQGHPLDALVAALGKVAAKTGQRFRFELAGRVIQTLPPTPDAERVEIVTSGWKPYEDSLTATRQADLLLVHTGPESQDIKIKIFEAAAVRRPVLVLGPEDSATVRLVREHVADPLVADQNDEPVIAAALERYLATADESHHAFTAVPAEYDRLVQSQRLLDWAKELTTETQSN